MLITSPNIRYIGEVAIGTGPHGGTYREMSIACQKFSGSVTRVASCLTGNIPASSLAQRSQLSSPTAIPSCYPGLGSSELSSGIEAYRVIPLRLSSLASSLALTPSLALPIHTSPSSQTSTPSLVLRSAMEETISTGLGRSKLSACQKRS
jgi:hypothetical protein